MDPGFANTRQSGPWNIGCLSWKLRGVFFFRVAQTVEAQTPVQLPPNTQMAKTPVLPMPLSASEREG